MAGLLDNFFGSSMDDPRTMANLQLAAGLLGGGSLGQAMGRGLGGYQQAMSASNEMARQKKKDTLFDEEMQWKRDERTQQKASDEAMKSAIIRMDPALQGMNGPSADFAPKQVSPQLASLYEMAKVDPNKYGPKLMEALAPKVSKLKGIETMTENGKPVQVAVYEDGQTKILPYGAKPDVQLISLGDRFVSVDKNAAPSGQTWNIGQSPDSKASNSLGWANNALSRQRLGFDMAGGAESVNGGKPQFNAELGGWAIAPNRSNPQGGFVPLPGNATGGAPKLTEDQAKASGWLVQANNAWSNMKGAMDGNSGAEKPGLGDAIGSVPMMGAVGNFLTGASRQQFNQGASSLSEALLRAATGAGVNKDEAQQKIKELTPQFGDKPEQIQQKMNAIPLYIETLKVRAGKGAQQVAPLLQRSQQNVAPSSQLGSGSFVPSDIADLLKRY